MSTEQNKAVVEWVYEEAFNKGNLSRLNEYVTPDWTFHGPGGVELKGPEGFAGYVAALRGAFPDLRITVENMIGQGDFVAHRIRVTGTNEGPFYAMPATGKKLSATSTTISRFSGGKEAEVWQELNLLDFYQQLGLAPGDAQAGIAAVKAQVQQIFGEAAAGNIDAFDQIYDKDVVAHRASQPDISGLAAYKEALAGLLQCFSGAQFCFDQMIIEGDTAASLWTLSGAHAAPFPGIPIPPTGKQITVKGLTLTRMKDGKAVEQWEFADMLGVMQQLGAIPGGPAK